jgi:hypothetical protein
MDLIYILILGLIFSIIIFIIYLIKIFNKSKVIEPTKIDNQAEIDKKKQSLLGIILSNTPAISSS